MLETQVLLGTASLSKIGRCSICYVPKLLVLGQQGACVGRHISGVPFHH